MKITFKTLAPAGPSIHEAFHEGILHWFSRRDVMPFDAGILTPGQYGMGGHFRSIVRDNHFRFAALPDHDVEFAHDPHTRQ